jgi:hypothetical protein
MTLNQQNKVLEHANNCTLFDDIKLEIENFCTDKVIVKLGGKDSVHYKGNVEFSVEPLTLTAIAKIAVRLGATPKTKIRYEIRE